MNYEFKTFGFEENMKVCEILFENRIAFTVAEIGGEIKNESDEELTFFTKIEFQDYYKNNYSKMLNSLKPYCRIKINGTIR